MADQTTGKVPRIRFKGFVDHWQKFPAGKLIRDHVEKTIIQNQYPVLTSSQQHGIVRQTDYFANRQVTTDRNIGYLVLPKGYFSYRSRSDNDSFIFNRNDIIEKGIISYYYPVFEVVGCDSEFFLRRINFGLQRQLRIAAEGTGQRVLAHSQFKRLTASYPELPEQERIGAFFRELDRLIALQRRKHEKLSALKKSMMQTMFPCDERSLPSLRFKGFSGKWDAISIEDAMQNIANNSLSRADLNYSFGLAKNIHYGDILVKFDELLDAQSDQIPMITNDAIAAKLGSSSLRDGDIVMADAAEDEAVGKCVELHNIGSQIVVAGLHTIALRPKKSFAPFFLGYYLNSAAFNRQLLPIMQGTKVLSISKTSIKRLYIWFPTDEAEQRSIGAYFNNLDRLIKVHATQIQKLNQIKDACLEKMFV